MDIDLDYHDYTVDQKELGKVMIVLFAGLLVTSAHAALQFRSAHDSINGLNKNLTKAQAIMESDSFNQSLEAIESVQGTEIGPRFSSAVEAFTTAGSSISEVEKVESDLESTYQLYQWLVLIAIMGEIAGLSLLYL